MKCDKCGTDITFVECEACRRPEGAVNHVPGHIFIGMGHGWQPCPHHGHDCIATLKAQLATAQHRISEVEAEREMQRKRADEWQRTSSLSRCIELEARLVTAREYLGEAKAIIHASTGSLDVPWCDKVDGYLAMSLP